MSYEELKPYGVTADTPNNIMLGAGTVHKNFYFGCYKKVESTTTGALTIVADTETPSTSEVKLSDVKKSCSYASPAAGDYVLKENVWNFKQSLFGATSGGNKLSIKPEIKVVELDGALVKVKGLSVKQGETATLETNLAEITTDLLKQTMLGKIADSCDMTGYDMIESKATIEEGDYLDNVAFVGKRADGKPLIVVLDNALCTSGFEGEGKNKDATVVKATFECYAEPDSDLTKLPYHIYYPSAV